MTTATRARRALRLALLGIITGVALAVGAVAMADTVNLKNGRALHARDTSILDLSSKDPRVRTIDVGVTRLLFANGGYMDVLTEDISSIEENDLDAFDS